MPERYLLNYIDRYDVDVVLSRIPADYKKRLRDIFFKRSRGVRVLGSVRIRGRRDINLCSALPPRVSLRGYLYRGQAASEFGAPPSGQWTPWAVRRYLLYDVLLHELGHLQIVRPNSKEWRRRYASETLAEEFADHWRRTLHSSKNFGHDDPIHFAPSDEEMEFLQVWQALDKAQRYELVILALKIPSGGKGKLSFLDEIPTRFHRFLDTALF